MTHRAWSPIPFRRPQACLAGLLAAAVLVGATLAVPPLHAQPVAATATAESRPAWDTLTRAQQEALAPLKGEWRVIDTARKQKWLEIAARMPAMSAADRERIQQRMTEWVRMSPADRGRARIQFQEAQQVGPTERQGRWEAYQALPADQRQALAAQSAARRPPAASAPAVTGPGHAASAGTERPRTATASVDAKRNVVPLAASQPATRQVAPTVVQVKPGATTSLVTTPAKPPAHHQAGLPKVNASADFVNPSTLLPLRGPQGAAVAALPASGPASAP